MATKTKQELVDRGFTAERAEPLQPKGPTRIRILVQQYIVGIYQACYIGSRAVPVQLCFRDAKKSNNAIKAMRQILQREGGWTIREHGTEPRNQER